MTSKIRITLTALTAAFAVAVAAASIAPAAQATTDDTIIVRPGDRFCDAKWDEFAVWVRAATEADQRGDTADRDYYLEQATKAKNAAAGCDWARRASVGSLSGGPAGDGLTVKQPDDSPAGGSDQTDTPATSVATETPETGTPETGNSAGDTSESKPKRHHKHHRKHKHHHKHKRTR
jgi:hypothetical protein